MFKPSSRVAKRPLNTARDDDDDDDENRIHTDSSRGGGGGINDEENSGADSDSPREVAHVKRAVKLLRSEKSGRAVPSMRPERFEMAGARSIVEIDDLRQARNERGYYADDGLPVARGARTSASGVVVGDPESAYGEKYINERLVRQRMLDANPFYRFVRQVAGNMSLELLVDESAISQETSERIRLAKAQLHRQQQRSQDSLIEQERTKQLRKQADEERDAHDDLLAKRDRFENARERLVMSMNQINTLVAVNIGPVVLHDNRTKFDRFTRVTVARYGAGGYRRSLLEARSIVEQLHGATYTRNTANPISEQLRKSMPQSSFGALLWATLFIVAQNSRLVERIRTCGGGALFASADCLYNTENASGSKLAEAMLASACVPVGSPNLHGGANLYADDLTALARLVFDNEQTDAARLGTDDLLLMNKLSQYLWLHVNKMLARAGSKQAPLERPTRTVAVARNANAGRTQKTVAGIVINFEVSDTDARIAASGEQVDGVPQEKLAAARRELYTNTDQARSLGVIIELLQPMLTLCYPMLFYANESTLDDGYDPEAFAGGYTENALYLLQTMPRNNVLLNADNNLAFIALLRFSESIVQASIASKAVRFEDGAALLELADPIYEAELLEAFESVLTVSDDAGRNYHRRGVDRWLRRQRALDAFAQFATLGSELRVLEAFTDNELALLRRYNEQAKLHTPGTTRDKKTFVPAEDAAMSVFANSRPLSVPGGSVLTGIDNYDRWLTLSQRYVYLLATTGVLADNRLRRLSERIALHAERAEQFEADWNELRARTQEWVRRTAERNAADIEAILRGDTQVEYVASANVAMAPINSGVIILSTLAVSAIADSFQYLLDYVPCVTATYTDSDDLIESDLYYVAFARLVRVQMRLTDAENPSTYRADKTEERTRVSRQSALNTVRSIARSDSAVSHYADARCTCFGLGSTAGSGRAQLSSLRVNWRGL